jgi:hypothetical protein
LSDDFTISGWGAGGATRPSAQAAEELRTTFLPPAAVMTFTIGTDFEALLGSDPKTMFPNAASLILAEGWGSDGTAQAIIIISQDGNGNHVWSGVVIAEYGFSASGDITLAGFESLLMQAVVERDFGQMRLLMGDPFAISGWNAGGSEWSPAEATDRLRTIYYPPAGHYVTFGAQPDLTTLLGQDPMTLFPGAASVLYSAGWGASGSGEAVLVVKQTATDLISCASSASLGRMTCPT